MRPAKVAVALHLGRGATPDYVREVLLAGDRGGMSRAAEACVVRTVQAALLAVVH